ncbi:MAG TPA: hypothetical protein VJK47_02010 [Dehalococcoidales bacterium]|nr:hypothetical protein [Dehalococcoidales bacterium]
MWRKKKVILLALLAALVLISIGGVVIAQAAEGASGNATQLKTIMARVAEILGIDQQKVEAAFEQAKNEAQADALKNRLQALVDAGKITQAQADAYLKWSQSKPDMAPYQQQLKDWMQNRPALPEDLKQWQQAKPDLPLPIGPRGGFRGRGLRGMRNMQGGGGGLNLSGTPLQ